MGAPVSTQSTPVSTRSTQGTEFANKQVGAPARAPVGVGACFVRACVRAPVPVGVCAINPTRTCSRTTAHARKPTRTPTRTLTSRARTQVFFDEACCEVLGQALKQARNDFRMRGSDSRSKGNENRSKGTDNRSKGTDN